MILTFLLSCIQIAALIYLGFTSVRINRMQTLSKNFDWVLHDRSFLEKYGEPLFWPLVVIGSIMSAYLLVISFSVTVSEFISIKYILLTAGIGITFLSYFVIDGKVKKYIPLKEERTARFVKRTLGQYLNPRWVTGAVASAAGTFVIIGASFVLNKISFPIFISYFSCAIIAFGLMWFGIVQALKEKIPHVNDITMVTPVDLGENFRSFSLSLQIGMVYFFSLLLVFMTVLQWSGYVIAVGPYFNEFYAFFGEKSPQFKPIFSMIQWENISSVFSTVFFIALVHCRQFKNITSIRLRNLA